MDPIDGIPPQESEEPREKALTRAERLVRKVEERIARIRLRAEAHEKSGQWDASETARYTLLTLETTLHLMRDHLRVERKVRDLDP
jgi:carboxylesterase type B